MKQRHTNIGLARLCDVFGKKRQTYYERIILSEKRQMEMRLIISLVLDKRKDMPRLGGLKLHYLLKQELIEHNISIGRDKLFSILRTHDLLVKPKRKYNKTTNSYHRFYKYPNQIKDIKVKRPNQVWVSDITYISIKRRFAYLSLITDLYSHKIIGYCLYKTLETKGCVIALQMALEGLKPPIKSLIHHSDRGIQYCSNQYVSILKTQNIQISMTEQKDVYQNAVAERVNGILKDEFSIDKPFKSYLSALNVIEKSIDIYNEKRPHLSCNMLTPNLAHNTLGELEKKW